MNQGHRGKQHGKSNDSAQTAHALLLRATRVRHGVESPPDTQQNVETSL
jgi:hypothetical protein